MSRVRFLIAVATVATGGALLVPSFASAHANAVSCVDQSTSTWRITNDHPLSETFTTTEGQSGSVAGGNGSFTDVVWNGDTLHVTGTWTDGFVGSTTGSGDCSPEVQPTTTTIEPTTTTLVTTTTAQETTTLVPTTPPATTGASTTTVIATTSSTTPTSTTVSSTLPSTSSTTPDDSSTTIPPTSVPSTTLPPPSSAPTTPPPTSTPSVPPTSTPTPCTGPANSPLPTSTNPPTPSAPPCGRLPATGNPDLGILTGIAAASIIAGAFMLTKTRR